ncbi:UvrD-helicase domain-containing protein [Desulfobulbus oligotrophicus]|uniref:UvrD-helicase domain-containing protein n=1 Tax=Desulfobulbus oligotrophicus TaxID=1909699 RepID=A0A7T5VB62_9BACT|nr:UvrD-helicase domain-containing protein [Desulfobulbus oligotrophicus]QQG64636.1 UvrD-helicase domain-containing protein [Desulfobulbus oligotrophicus]
MANFIMLAVAGSRKTQGIVEHCASLPHDRRALVLTYTQANQSELRSRLAKYAGDRPNIVVMGWFTFLLREFARPFLPFMFAGERVCGFNFEGEPHRMAKGRNRFLDAHGCVYRSELGRLAHELVGASKGALLRRIECIYDEILIDEVQDLSGHDWEIVDVLLSSAAEVRMVGDIRQAVLSTNPRSGKNKKYAYAEAVNWFREREALGVLSITENTTTWRCHPKIAEFSDTIFDASWSFPCTKSVNEKVTGHDGVFLLRHAHVGEYLRRFRPQCLRDSANSGKAFDLEYINFRLAKGMTFNRVLIAPTSGITYFVQTGTYLDPIPAAKLYVAVTRAAQSVAFIIDKPGKSTLPYWEPESGDQP